jgi:hypothetical protein
MLRKNQMKQRQVYGLFALLTLMLTGCLDTTKTELTPPSDVVDYGLSYSPNARVTEARMDTIDALQAFALGFEYHHRHQPIFHFWHEAAMSLVGGDNIVMDGTCSGSLTQNVTTNEDNTLSRELLFDNYCNPTLLWNTHSDEYGRQQYSGNENLFNVDYFNYQKNMSAYYDLALGGRLRVAITADTTTYNYEDLVVKQLGSTLEYRYENFKITFEDGLAIYNGRIYHPDYGWVEVSTGQDVILDRVQTAEDENQRLNRPIAGRIQIKGRVGTGILTFNNDQSYNLELDLGGDPADNPAALTNQAWPN